MRQSVKKRKQHKIWVVLKKSKTNYLTLIRKALPIRDYELSIKYKKIVQNDWSFSEPLCTQDTQDNNANLHGLLHEINNTTTLFPETSLT